MASDLDPIAMWGAITGTLAVGIQLAAFLVDRPRLVARYDNEYPDAIVVITNMGRRPIALRGAGLFLDRVDWRYRLRRMLRRSKRIRVAVPLSSVDAPTTVLLPGEAWIARRPMTEVMALVEPLLEGGIIDAWPTEIYATTPSGRTFHWPVTTHRGENIAQLTSAARGTVTAK